MSPTPPPNSISFSEIFENAYAFSSPMDYSKAEDKWKATVGKVLFEVSSAYFKAKKFKLTKKIFFKSSYVRSKSINTFRL